MKDEDYLFPIDLAYQVSPQAALLYCYIVDMTVTTGECHSVVEAAARAALGNFKQIMGCVEDLQEAGFIETWDTPTPIAEAPGHWVIMGHVVSARPKRIPKRVSRLSPQGWAKLRKLVFKRDDYTCSYCGKRGVKLECDHVIPIAAGGTNELGNLATACRDCNRAKRSKVIERLRDVMGSS